MRRILLILALLALPSRAAAQGKLERLGSVAIDGVEATVDFQDCLDEQGVYRVVVTVPRPRKTPPVKASRVMAWLLEDDRSRAMPPYDEEVTGTYLPEEGAGDKVVAKGVFVFRASVMRGGLVAAVVAIDREPKAFKIAQPTSGVDPKVIAAWRKAGARIGGVGEPWFHVGHLRLPPGAELPLPKVPFGLSCTADAATVFEPGFLTKLPGRHQARSLGLSGVTLPEADLKELAGLKQLESLSMDGDKIGDREMKAVAGLRNLKRLTLFSTVITDAGLKELAGLKALETLSLDGVRKITDAGLKELAPLQELRDLDIAITAVTDAGLAELARLPKLHTLMFGAGPSGVGLKALAGHQGLQVIHLYGDSISDEGCRHLAGLKNLREVDLYQTRIGDEALKGLAGLTELRTLNLGSTKITDAGLKQLAGLKKLETLTLSGTSITGTGLRELTGLKELTVLDLRDTKVTDANLAVLASLPKLRTLRVYQNDDVTARGIAELRKAMPGLFVAR